MHTLCPLPCADLFRALKASHDEPDAQAAARVGVPDDATAGAESVVNQPAIDLLRRLPGEP